MADETKRFMKPENLGVSAIVIALLTGGGGLTLNSYSNATVVKALEDVKTSVVRMEQMFKSADEDKVQTRERLEKLDAKVSTLEQSVAVLKSQMDKGK